MERRERFMDWNRNRFLYCASFSFENVFGLVAGTWHRSIYNVFTFFVQVLLSPKKILRLCWLLIHFSTLIFVYIITTWSIIPRILIPQKGKKLFGLFFFISSKSYKFDMTDKNKVFLLLLDCIAFADKKETFFRSK